MAAAAITVRVVEQQAEMKALAGAWEELQESSAVTSVFASFDWQQRWWDHYHREQPLRLLLATTDDGAVVGILPLYIDTADMLRYPVRLLRFIGTGGDTFPDDLGPLLAPSREVDVARALADAVLALPGWDVLQLSDMDPSCAFAAVMESAARRRWLPCFAGRSEKIAFLDLPPTWDAWLQTLHRDRRYRIKNARKKLIKAHPTARFFVWDDPATLHQGVDRLIHLHRKRWESAGEEHGFSSPQYVGFHRAVMSACLARDRLRLYCLEIDGQVVAMYYFYCFRQTVYLMQSGFDPELRDVRPGQVLLGHIVEHAIGEGHKVLDFLRGDHRYKDELATGQRETVFLTALRFRPGALVYRARRSYLPALKQYLLRTLRRVRPGPPPTETSTTPATTTTTPQTD